MCEYSLIMCLYQQGAACRNTGDMLHRVSRLSLSDRRGFIKGILDLPSFSNIHYEISERLSHACDLCEGLSVIFLKDIFNLDWLLATFCNAAHVYLAQRPNREMFSLALHEDCERGETYGAIIVAKLFANVRRESCDCVSVHVCTSRTVNVRQSL